jgi:hypothetical protein
MAKALKINPSLLERVEKLTKSLLAVLRDELKKKLDQFKRSHKKKRA